MMGFSASALAVSADATAAVAAAFSSSLTAAADELTMVGCPVPDEETTRLPFYLYIFYSRAELVPRNHGRIVFLL